MKNLKKLSRVDLKKVKGGNAPSYTPECGETCGNDDTFCTGSCNRCCGGVCSNG